ncbi:fungal-specific transcription factor domain-containing protein [Xylogone sp. PMI_703]|nr:fungal-specific transcription factor domain-containing protein [Xylogone sp. PMI_703]
MDVIELIESHTSASNPGRSRRRAVCSTCRRRKTKCDSRQPQCSACKAHKSSCHYDKPPSLAYVRSLEARIERLLREKNSTTELDSDNLDAQNERLEVDRPEGQYLAPFTPRSIQDVNIQRPTLQQLPEKSHESQRANGRWIFDISIDRHGAVAYHNSTSAIHEAPSYGHSLPSSSGKNVNSFPATPQFADDQGNATLLTNLGTPKELDSMVVRNIAAVQSEVPGHEGREFLKYYWCWIHPMFMFVDRPSFTREMASRSPEEPDGPYFSETLLKVLLAHSARYGLRSSRDKETASRIMTALTEQAHMSLALRVTKPSSLPTIQALLQQSAREMAFGNSSQAWLYSGMAFRIAIDLGIHLPGETLRVYVKNLTAEDIEVRKRLFWSCYTWDKAISLYLGRMPAFTLHVESNPPVFTNNFLENDLWEPYYGFDSREDVSARTRYSPQKGYMISCFTWLSKLSMILSAIMLEIYSSSAECRSDSETASSKRSSSSSDSQTAKNSAFVRISSSLQRWWMELPDFLRLNVRRLPQLSPPLHIVSLNLLYNATLILLHRPFIIGATDFSNPAVCRSYQICIGATASMHDLLELLTATFGYVHTSYLNCYSTYIGATITVLRFQLQEEQTISLPCTNFPSPEKLELRSFLAVLQHSAVGMPGLNRSVEIIKKHMEAILERRSKRYLETLFLPPPPGNGCVSSSMDTTIHPLVTQPAPAIVQPLHSPYNEQQFSPSISFPHHTGRQQLPLQSQQMEGSSYNMASYVEANLDGLPAFPGQNFNVGTDWTLDQDIIDPEMRAVLLGLDPHVALHHDNSDWTTYSGGYF